MPSQTRTVLGLILLTTVKHRLLQTTEGNRNFGQNVAALTHTESHTTLVNMIAVTTLSWPILANAENFPDINDLLSMQLSVHSLSTLIISGSYYKRTLSYNLFFKLP